MTEIINNNEAVTNQTYQNFTNPFDHKYNCVINFTYQTSSGNKTVKISYPKAFNLKEIAYQQWHLMGYLNY